MIMDLPQRYRLKTFARVRQQELLVFRSSRFEDMMFSMTYALRKRVCVYCGKVMNAKNCSLDHRYPIDIGGISITNNLFPCCPECNSVKSNLTHEEYLVFRNLPNNKKNDYRTQVQIKNENIKKAVGFRLPHEWVTYLPLQSIMYHRQSVELYGFRYTKIMEHYSMYRTFLRPAIVDYENHLLDGYNIILFARENKIEYVPAIKLSNVRYFTKRQTFVQYDTC